MAPARPIPPRSGRRSPGKAASIPAILGLCASIAAGPGSARADGLADEAELHFQLGTSAYQRSEFMGALEHFLVSNRLVPNRRVVYNIARAFEQLKQFDDAHRYYIDALAGETDPEIIKTLNAAIARVTPNVSVIDVTTTPPGATIYLNRKDLGSRGRAPRPLAVSAGSYRVIAELDGYEPATSEVIVAKTGASQRIELALRRIVGKVHIEVEGGGGAAVHVNEEAAPAACAAPCDIDLPPGLHQLYLTREGYRSSPLPVNVVAGKTSVVTAALSPVTGTLIVNADERGAQVLVDGRVMGFTPAVITDAPTGTHEVKVVLRGYAPFSAKVDISRKGETQLPPIDLVPLREVTAVSRHAEKVDDAPSSVSIIDGREIRAFGYPTIVSALYGVRGVSVANDRVYSSVSIRGVGQPFDYGNRVLVLSDGQPLNDNILNSSYIGSDGRADLGDVSSIEVVRGPGSLLYGAGAFSGVVNLVTRPRDEPSQVHVSLGTYDDRVIRGRAGFHYNFAPDKGVWASVSAAQSDGVTLTFPLKDSPKEVTVSSVERFKSFGAAGRAFYGPLTAQWFYHRREQVEPIGSYAAEVNDTRTTVTDTRMMAEVRYEPRLSPSFELMTRAHVNRYLYEGVLIFDESRNEEKLKGTWLGAEARLVYSPGPRLRVTVGGEGQLHLQASLEGVEHPTSGPPSSYLDIDEPYKLAAGYALVEATPLSWLRVAAGARVDVYSTFGPIVVPRGALIFKPIEGGTLKVMGGRAFRAPSIYERLYSDGGVAEVPAVDSARGLTLGPESIYSGEIEYSQRFLTDWIALAAGYISRAQGLIGVVPDTPGSDVVRYANLDAPAMGFGGDIEVRREWRRGWMLGGSYGYQRAEFVDPTRSNPRLVNVPEHLASVRGVAPLVHELASIGLRATLESPRRISSQTDEVTQAEIVLDATVSGEARAFGLSYVVGVYNIADRRVSVPVADTFRARTMPQNGRTFMVQVTGSYP